jgi:hypothetical protein
VSTSWQKLCVTHSLPTSRLNLKNSITKSQVSTQAKISLSQKSSYKNRLTN